jgi:hypothetical protein
MFMHESCLRQYRITGARRRAHASWLAAAICGEGVRHEDFIVVPAPSRVRKNWDSRLLISIDARQVCLKGAFGAPADSLLLPAKNQWHPCSRPRLPSEDDHHARKNSFATPVCENVEA